MLAWMDIEKAYGSFSLVSGPDMPPLNRGRDALVYGKHIWLGVTPSI